MSDQLFFILLLVVLLATAPHFLNPLGDNKNDKTHRSALQRQCEPCNPAPHKSEHKEQRFRYALADGRQGTWTTGAAVPR